MTTEIVRIPSDASTLHGVVHLPRRPAAARAGVILNHENFNTKFGTHRLYHQLAEALAADGFYVLRHDNRRNCDSPGIGDLTFAERVADARSAQAFFRARHGLEKLAAWGLCMGGAVTVHAAARARRPDERLDAIVLCNPLTHPEDASLPQFGYRKVTTARLRRDLLGGGDLFRKLLRAPGKIGIYRQNLGRIARALVERYLRPTPEFSRLQAAIAEVGPLLASYRGPCLLLFGENDVCLESFTQRVNPEDRLGLAKKARPAEWAIVAGADHTFSSAEHTREMIRRTREWLLPLLGTRREDAEPLVTGK